MGCGASRGAPVPATLAFVPRIEKERDDTSLEPVQLKRLGIDAYDDFFAGFETTVNNVVDFNNKLHDALWDAKAALAFASSPDPEYALDLEVTTVGIRSVPQLLVDVTYADGNSRPLPFEVRHLLTSRPVIAEADMAVGQAVEELAATLQSHPAPAQLSYDESKLQLTVIPVGGGPSVPGAAQQHQRLHQRAARVSSALAAMRKAAPGLRFLVTVVPSPAPGARTFAWRLLSRPDASKFGRTQGLAASASSPVAATKRVATPLQVASAHGASTIMEAAATVARQAAAIAAAVTTAAAPLMQLQLEEGRRLVSVVPPGSSVAAVVAASAQRGSRPGSLLLHSLSLTRGAEASGTAAAAGAVSTSKGITAAARVDEAAAVLRRALSSANRALFRLAKCATAGASSGRDAAALREGDPSAFPLSKAVTLVLEAAIHAARQVAGTAAVMTTPPLLPPPAGSSHVSDNGTGDDGSGGGGDGGGGDGSGGDCSGGALSVSELISVAPQLHAPSESGSMLSGSMHGGYGGYSGARSTASGCNSSGGAFIAPLLSKDCGGGGGGGGAIAAGNDGLTPGCSWFWVWGIHPLVCGVSFPDCLPPKARAVYDAVNRVVEAANSITEQLPLLHREVLARVYEAEAVFAKNEERLAAAAHDMMSAGRMRAALDRNANTISASPALLGLLQTAVARLTGELRRGAEQMRAMAEGDPDGDVDADCAREDQGSSRCSGSRSIMARQLNKAAAVAAAAVAAAATAMAEEKDGGDAGSEVEYGLGLEFGCADSGGACDRGDGSGNDGDSIGGNDDGEYSGGGGGGGGSGGVSSGGSTLKVNGAVRCGTGLHRGSGSGTAAAADVGAGVGTGAGDGVVRGGLKHAVGPGQARADVVSRRVMLPPLSST